MIDSTSPFTSICELNDSPVERNSSCSDKPVNRIVTNKPGRQNVAIKVYMEVEGSGSFKAGDHNTSNGIDSMWTRPQAVLHLEASPGPGHRFSHWVVQNEFAGGNRHRRAVANQGMSIKAVFVPITTEDIRIV